MSDFQVKTSYCGNESVEKAKPQKEDFLEKTHELNQIKKVIGVVSGKGGVGKSLVTAMLAVMTRRKGYQVGILDADITGPSIPKMFGVTNRPKASELGIFPERTGEQISIMSVNLLLESEDKPVIWRGPILSNAVKQFWTDVIWEDLDFLFLDMPPGTGDVTLTVFQSLPLDGIIIVTTPQDLVQLIVKKAYNMAKEMEVPILGIVENMSSITCPDCGKEFRVFGDSNIEDIVAKLGLKVLGRLPLNPAVAELCDRGEIERLDQEVLPEAVAALEKHLGS